MNILKLSIKKSLIAMQIDKMIIVLGAMFFLPFLFHSIPYAHKIPLGAIWLPIFYAPLISVIRYKFHIPVLASIIAPTLNNIFTGMPKGDMVKILMFDLVLFVIAFKLLSKVTRFYWLAAPISYISAKYLSSLIFSAQISFAVSIPGLIVLSIIGYAANEKK